MGGFAGPPRPEELAREEDIVRRTTAELGRRFAQSYQNAVEQQATYQQAAYQQAMQAIYGHQHLQNWGQATYREEAPAVEEGEMVNEFLIGCDPEFAVLDNKGGMVDCNVLGRGEIGVDHGGRVAELRPRPAKGAYTLLKRIQTLLKDEKLSRLPGPNRFKAGAVVRRNDGSIDTLGGHIHLDVNPYASIPEMGYYPVYSETYRLRVQALDGLTKTLEILDILPQREARERRKLGAYGQWGEVRVQGSRPHYRMEYRTMASWLFSPIATMICLTVAKLGVAEPKSVWSAHKGVSTFEKFRDWVAGFKSHDMDAARVVEKILDKGHKFCIADPDSDFRKRWEVLPA